MTELRNAAQLAAEAAKPYPNDSAEYRAARVELLADVAPSEESRRRLLVDNPESLLAGGSVTSSP